MKILKVKVTNYRLLKDFELDFRENLSLIVGKNNCGKTSVVTIMDKLLGLGESKFSWNDFNLEFQKSFFDEIQLYSISREKFNLKDNGIKMQVFIDYNESDNYANIQHFMMNLEADNNIVILEFFYSCKEDSINKLITDMEDIGIKRDNFDEFSKFMNKHSSKYFRLQRYAREYDIISQESTDNRSEEIKFSEIKKLISIKAIKANREASNKINDSSLSSLSQKYYNTQIIEDFDLSELQKAIKVADDSLSEAYNGTDDSDGIFTEIFKSVEKFGPETNLTIQSSISETDLLKNNTTLYYTTENSHLPESYNGLGYLNLIGMILEIETNIAEFYGKENEKSADINILFIEEPEAHTHPQLQYVFIKNIKKLLEERKEEKNINLQTVITTHSSHIVSECDFSDIRYLKRNKNSIESKNFKKLEEQYHSDKLAFKFIKQYLDLSRSELFFTEKVIFIEGDTERILLPAMMKKVDLEHRFDETYVPLLSQNISIIETGAHSHIFKPLINFLGIKTLIITDIDGIKKEVNDNGTKKKGGKACPSVEATHTSNQSLINFFNLQADDQQFATLTKKVIEEKQINEDTTIVYQTLITIDDGKYQPRSFEDSFICSNLEYIKLNIDNFSQGLKNKSEIDLIPTDYYKIAEKCVAKKSAFATEILFYDGETKNAFWETPDYIKEGLEWLQRQ